MTPAGGANSRESDATEKMWPTETREQVLARVRAEHGPEVAAVVAHDWETRVKVSTARGAKWPKNHARPSKVGRYRRLKRSTRR